ncbi:MAG TPA: RNA polymerase sigma factor, partial [Micavibrio sp.]
TFLRVLEKRHYFEQGTSLRKWASKIMFNLFVTEYRRKTKFETRYDPEPYLQSQSVGAVQEDRAELSAVGDAMKRLSPDHREILVMVCVKDMPYQQVSEILNIPVGTVRSRLSRARDHLQMILDASPAQESAGMPLPPAYVVAHTQRRAA